MLNSEEQLIHNLNFNVFCLDELMEWEGFSIYYTFFLSECQSFSADLK